MFRQTTSAHKINGKKSNHQVVCSPEAARLSVKRSYRLEIWHAHRQHWCGDACQISDDRATQNTPDSKVHGANMGPTWVLSAPAGPHVCPMNLGIRDIYRSFEILRDLMAFRTINVIKYLTLTFCLLQVSVTTGTCGEWWARIGVWIQW